MMDLQLTGKRALVCGASHGIGAACALALAELGCRVIALARQEHTLQQLIETLPGQGHSYLVADLTQHSNLTQLIENELKTNGDIAILLNNSGGPTPGPIRDAQLEQFQRAFDQHLKANVLLAQHLLPGMQQAGYGRIINIISTSVKAPIPNLGVSNTIRWAVASWAKTLASEVAPFGITVNSVLPGATQTARLDALLVELAQRNQHSVEEEAQHWRQEIPCRRFGKPSEIANVVAFLASPAASYVNGVALAVDGGRTASL